MCLPVLLLAACNSTEMVEGKVVDIWGNPIEGATVMVVGGDERPLTDREGRYRLARIEGTHVVKAGRKGYIQDHHDLVVTPGQPAEGPLFELYPKPEERGIFAVGAGQYVPLSPVKVHATGSVIQTLRGVEAIGDGRVETANPRFVYHTDLREDEILRLGLELRRLVWTREADVTGPMGPTRVSVNLWIDGGAVPMEITPLRSKTDYLLTVGEPLVEGEAYAFQMQDLLTPGAEEQFERIHEDLRVVYPFEMR
jgi:hypothetical protein